MEKLKERILKLASSKSNTPLSPIQIALIEHKLLLAFPVLHTPTHPTYAVMIQNAIEGLNERDGSNEESISDYIKASYDGLPWAHDTYLSHHLSVLCRSGEIVCTSSTNRCYTTPALALLNGRCPSKKPSKRRLVRKRGELGVEVVKDGISSGEEVDEVKEFEEEDVMMFSGSRVNRLSRRSLVVFEEEDNDGVLEAAADEADATTSVAELMVVPFECVDKSSLALSSPRKLDTAEHPVEESGLKERELMIVPYEGKTRISSEIRYPMIVCGLAMQPNPKQQECKNSLKKKSKTGQENKEVSRELMPSLFTLPKPIQQEFKYPTKNKLKAHREKKDVSWESMPSLPGLGMGSNLLEQGPLNKLLSQRGLETKVSGMESQIGPPWLMSMLEGRYHITCSLHAVLKKSKCNMFCLDCMGNAFCLHCFPLHNKDHRVIQIRRSSYHNVVRVDEINGHLDLSGIQTYIINSAKIVFLSTRPQTTSGKGSCTCKICGRRLLDSSSFCSLGCKFKERQEACISSMLEDRSVEQLEKQKNLDPLFSGSFKELMQVEDEEDLPLLKILDKCGKRKKDGVQKRIAKRSLVTEASSETETNSTGGETASMLCQIDIRENHEVPKLAVKAPLEMESSSEPAKSHELVHPEAEPSEFSATGRMVSDNLLSQQENDHQQPITVSPLSEQSLQNPKHPIEGRGHNKNDVRLQDHQPPMATFEKEDTLFDFEKCEQKTKKSMRELQGRSRKHLDVSKEDTVPSLNDDLQLQEGLSILATYRSLKQQDKGAGRGRLRKEKEGIKEEADLLNLQSQQQRKKLKKGRGRPRKQKEAIQEDAVTLSGLPVKELSKAAIDDINKEDQGTTKI